MNRLISVINKLQDIFNTIGADSLQLPQIVVVGTQSSGKSSVIENIVGRDFLPRGSGMVTKRPLILQLVYNGKSHVINQTVRTKELSTENINDLTNNLNIEENSQNQETYAEFLHIPNKKFFNFLDIHDEIIRETNRILEDEKMDVSSEPIRLRIYSPDVLNLSLVDLPGLTKIPIGRQAVDIESKILDMTMNFINNKNSIILAVTPANIDIATSEALKIASIADPNGERTLACLTKLDLMDRGTNAINILTGKVLNLKMGIIGVVNRSQQDIDNKKSISMALQDEEQFFDENYKMLGQGCGTKHLVKTLNRILLNHIKKCLPELKERVHNLLMKFQVKVRTFGEPIIDKKFALLNILTQFATVYSGIVAGTSSNMTTSELCGGARIYYIYHDFFGKKIHNLDPLEGISDKDIKTAIRNAKGMKPSLFVPEIAFELLVRRQISKLEYPSIECITLVHEELLRITSQAAEQIPEFLRFPVLKENAIDTVKNVLTEEADPTVQMVHHLINSELSYINTNHPSFIETANSASEGLSRKEASILPLKERLNTLTTETTNEPNPEIETKENRTVNEEYNDKRIQSHLESLHMLIKSYMIIIHHKFQDSIPKFISCFLVNKVVNRLQSVLVDKLFKDELVEQLLFENEEVVVQRKNIHKMIEALTNANKVISEIKDTKL